METLLFCAMLATGFGAMWWQRARVRRALGPGTVELADDAEVAVHLAQHEARSRGRSPAPLHLLYALVQNGDIAEVITGAGGDVAAIEDRLYRALDEDTAGDDRERALASMQIVAWAVFVARRGERMATCFDLWGGLVQLAPQVAALVETGGVGAADVLFAMVHGAGTAAPDHARDVAVVLVNDDITTQTLVVDILRDVFELDEPRAHELMRDAHEHGRRELGRFPAATARARVADAHRIARKHGSPLWLRLEG